MDLPVAETQTVTNTVHVDVPQPFMITARPVFIQSYDGSFVNLSSIKQLYVYQGKIAGYWYVYGTDLSGHSYRLSEAFSDERSALEFLNLIVVKFSESAS